MMTSSLLRWTPAFIAVGAVAAAAIGVPLAASASSPLPHKTPSQVIELMASSHVSSLSGTIEQTSDLGLPSLPKVGAGSDSSASSTLELLTGSHTANIYLSGTSDARIQVLDQLAERDVIRHGSDVWIYDSKNHTAQHATITAKQHGLPAKKVPMATPSELATKLLGQLKSTSTITVGADVAVAGHSAYDLILRPKATDTLLGSVSIAVDSTTGLPLRVELNARGQSAPAVSVGFSSVTFAKPAASIFAFTPPSNTKVTQLDKQHAKPKADAKPKTQAKAKPATTVTGKGWDAVVSISKTSADSELTGSPLFAQLTTPVTGGRVFHTSLLNVLITTDGRIIAGSVSIARLQAVAAAS
ncbi:MAG: hypothetical protein JWR36_2088 [Glaciihabitans sp.]|nr:hypothetical protein [Glaciihabitans sp.]